MLEQTQCKAFINKTNKILNHQNIGELSIRNFLDQGYSFLPTVGRTQMWVTKTTQYNLYIKLQSFFLLRCLFVCLSDHNPGRNPWTDLPKFLFGQLERATEVRANGGSYYE